jgi:hypothetical protein
VSLSVLLSPAPGWYPDPAGAATYRWWDGDAWTEGTHAGDSAPAQTPAPQVPAPHDFEPQTLAPIPLFVNTEPAVGAPATAAGPAPAPATERARPATASTPVVRRGVSPAKTKWSSILSAYPFVYPFAVGMVVALGYAGGAASNMVTLIVIGAIAALVLLAPAWMIADADRKELTARGYEPAPSMAWMLLLPPIGYLIARRRVVGPTY